MVPLLRVFLLSSLVGYSLFLNSLFAVTEDFDVRCFQLYLGFGVQSEVELTDSVFQLEGVSLRLKSLG